MGQLPDRLHVAVRFGCRQVGDPLSRTAREDVREAETNGGVDPADQLEAAAVKDGRAAGRRGRNILRRRCRGEWTGSRDRALQRGLQGGGRGGLDDAVVHPGRKAAGAVAVRIVRGERDDRCVAPALAVANLRRSPVAVHPGHFAVHHDRVIQPAGEGGNRLVTVLSDLDVLAISLEQVPSKQLIAQIVLGEQHAAARAEVVMNFGRG